MSEVVVSKVDTYPASVLFCRKNDLVHVLSLSVAQQHEKTLDLDFGNAISGKNAYFDIPSDNGLYLWEGFLETTGNSKDGVNIPFRAWKGETRLAGVHDLHNHSIRCSSFGSPGDIVDTFVAPEYAKTMNDIKKAYIAYVMTKVNNNISEAAIILDICDKTIKNAGYGKVSKEKED